MRRRIQRLLRLLSHAALAALLAAPALAQIPPPTFDAGHSYATLWMGRQTEATPIVNAGVAQLGGRVNLDALHPAASTLEFALVPGGQGPDLLAPDGSLRPGVLARLLRYSTMTFRSTIARVRRDGYLEFSGELAVSHVTREQISSPWNSANNAANYTDPKTTAATRTVAFVLAAPRAEFLAAYLRKNTDLLVTATVNAPDFPELPDAVLDSSWPAFAQDAECPTLNTALGVRDNISLLCTGKVISTTASLQRAQTSGLDYSGLRKYDAPTDGPVTILLHLKLAAPPPASPAR